MGASGQACRGEKLEKEDQKVKVYFKFTVEKLIKKQPIRSQIILQKLAGYLYDYFNREIK